MKMMKSKRAVSLLLTAALVVTGGVSGSTVQAAKKGKKQSAKVSSVKITNTGKKLRLQKGKKFRLKTSVKVKPNKSKNKKLKFTSSNRKIVLVNSKGLLKGMKEGTARITAASKTNPKKKASITVSVTKDVLVMSIKLNKTKITADEFNDKEIPLKVKKILPANAKNKKVKWSTSDENVADVDDDGVVTTGDAGVAVIKAQAADQGGAFATCKVVVLENEDNGDDEADGAEGQDATQAPAVPEQPAPTVPKPDDVPDQPPASEQPTKTPNGPQETDLPTEMPEDPTAKPTATGTMKPMSTATVKPTSTATVKPTATATAEPTPTVIPPSESPIIPPSIQDYEYFDNYTLGWSGGEIVAYKAGKKMSLSDAGVDVYDKDTDNIFAQHIPNNKWNDEKIILTPPVQYTTSDGVVHNVDSMLTNWNFMADPTAIDNSDVDGKLYVYGTTESIDYISSGMMQRNGYNNHSLSITSTRDMVNWTDEGIMDNKNLTNEPGSSSDKEECGWGTKAWVPSGLKIDVDGDGRDEYYLFYTNGTAIGYVQGDSPTGPWNDLNKDAKTGKGTTLLSRDTPNCKGVVWCFDPAVLVDDRGEAYIYFGGGVPDKQEAHPKTGRVVKIKFDPETKKVELDGDPQELDAFYFFGNSEINQFHGKYYYSYCTNFQVPGSVKADGALNPIRSGEIACYVSEDPMDITFDPEKRNSTDSLKFMGSIMDNPSRIYGKSYNNHHHMQSFKGHEYMFYHSTVLENMLYHTTNDYRCVHVDEITVDEDTDEIEIMPTYEGTSQIEDFEPYVNEDGSIRYINATTSASSAGVKSLRDDVMVLGSINGSPMVLDEIDTGDWTCIRGVNFGENGLNNIGVEYLSGTDEGRIEVFIDSPTKSENLAAAIEISETDGKYVFNSAKTIRKVTDKHDVYFVFRGSGYKVASWSFSEKSDGNVPDLSDRPDVPGSVVTPRPPVTPKPTPNIIDSDEYTLDLESEIWTNGFYDKIDNADGSITLTRQKGDEDWQVGEFGFAVPRDKVGDLHEFTEIIIKYRDSDLTVGTGKCGYVFHMGDTTDVGWNENEDVGHGGTLSFIGDGQTSIYVGETKSGKSESNFSTVRICDGKIGGKITIESITLTKGKKPVYVPTEKPKPTPDAYVPAGSGWQRLDLSTWGGSSENYLETGDQIVLSNAEYETIALPRTLDNVGDKIEVLIRGSVPEGSDGFRYWVMNGYGSTLTTMGHYSAFGEGVEDPRNADPRAELDVSAFNAGEFQVQRVLEHINKDGVADNELSGRYLMLKGPSYGTTLDGVIITGIWVRYGEDIEGYTLDLETEFWANDWCDKTINADGSITLTRQKGDEDWQVGEFGFAVPRDKVGDLHEFTEIIIKYRDSDLTDDTSKCGYLFHMGDTTKVDWLEGEDSGHPNTLSFDGSGQTSIYVGETESGESERNFSTIRIWDGKIGGKITIESITMVKGKEPTPTPDAYVPQGPGWQKLDLSAWSGSGDNYIEAGDQIILSDTEVETIPLPRNLDAVGDKIEVLIRGSVSEDSDGFRYWVTNDNCACLTTYAHYSKFGEGIEDPRNADDPKEDLDQEAFQAGQFQVQRVLEHINRDGVAEDQMTGTKLLLKGPSYGSILDGVVITGIWVRYGDDIGLQYPDVETPGVEVPTPSPTEKPDVKELDLMGELWTNGFYDRIVNEDGSITLTREQGDQDWQVGEFGFAVPRDLVGDPHEFTKVIIKYRNSDLTDSGINCGYVFHFGDDTEVGWIEEEGGYHTNSLPFDGSGETVIRIDGEEESNFSTVRIFDGKIGGKITIESVTLA